MKNRILTLTLLLLLAATAGAQTTTVTLHPNDGLWNFSSLGATLTSGQLLLPTCSSYSAPAISHPSDPDTGFCWLGSNRIAVIMGGAELYRIDASQLIVASNRAISFNSATSTLTGSPDVFLYRDAANTLALRNGTNAQAFNIYNTYTDGSNYELGRLYWTGNVLTLGTAASGSGTVRGLSLISASGSINVQGHISPSAADTYDYGLTNSIRNALISRSIQGSKSKALTESSATAAWDCALAAGAHTGGTLHYCVYAADATDQQERCASIKVAAVNKAGTTSITLSPGTVNETTDGNAGVLTAGTLTYAVTAADTTDSFSISFNAVSSLTQTTLQSESRWDIMTPATCTPQ